MRQGTVLQLRTDLLDDRMLAVDLISNNGVETIVIDGGEERVVPEQIEQSALSGSAFGLVELRDASDHQTARSLQRLLLRGERGEWDFSDQPY